MGHNRTKGVSFRLGNDTPFVEWYEAGTQAYMLLQPRDASRSTFSLAFTWRAS